LAKSLSKKSKLQNIKPTAMKKAFLFCLSSILLVKKPGGDLRSPVDMQGKEAAGSQSVSDFQRLFSSRNSFF